MKFTSSYILNKAVNKDAFAYVLYMIINQVIHQSKSRKDKDWRQKKNSLRHETGPVKQY